MVTGSWLVTVLAAVSAHQQGESFRLDNGMQVVLERVEGHGIAAVGLALRAGVFDEPEGRCGISHVLEHLFLYGATDSFPSPFDTLTRDGPLGQPFMDVNAETMWSMTYFYALRPASGVEETLKLFAEKMDHVRLTQALLDRERPRALGELRSVAQMMDSNPVMRRQLEAMARYPKAGIEAHITALTLEELEAYRRNQYRPDRAVLVVYGEIDLKNTRETIETLFSPLEAKPSRRLEAASREGLPEQQIVTYPCAGATQKERDALRVAAVVWQQMLREHGRAYVELPADGSMRVVLFGHDAEPIAQTREELLEGLSRAELGQARRQAGQMARLRGVNADPQRLQESVDRVPHARGLAQAVIDRLIVETEGGKRFLEALDSITPGDLRAAATRYLK